MQPLRRTHVPAHEPHQHIRVDQLSSLAAMLHEHSLDHVGTTRCSGSRADAFQVLLHLLDCQL